MTDFEVNNLVDLVRDIQWRWLVALVFLGPCVAIVLSWFRAPRFLQ